MKVFFVNEEDVHNGLLIRFFVCDAEKIARGEILELKTDNKGKEKIIYNSTAVSLNGCFMVQSKETGTIEALFPECKLEDFPQELQTAEIVTRVNVKRYLRIIKPVSPIFTRMHEICKKMGRRK